MSRPAPLSKVLVLGAGFVAGPLARSLFEETPAQVAIADLDPDRAAALAAGRPRFGSLGLDLSDEAALREAIGRADVVVSLVPFVFHPAVARHCLSLGKHLVTTSYVSEAMRNLDGPARAAGLIFLNESGLDPGLDHMEAARIVHEIRGRGGRVRSFTSYCGGLPAPEANTNPFGYKFSWSPRGVLLAGRNGARFRREGRDVVVPPAELFRRTERISVEGLGDFEGYANRDSLPYIDLYGIPETRTMVRGTLRYFGWCETFEAFFRTGFLDIEEADLAGMTYADFLRRRLGAPAGEDPGAVLRRALAGRRGDEIAARWEWLGLASAEPIPLAKGSPLDVLESLMTRRLRYGPGERDMVVLRHVFESDQPGGAVERIVSTLVDYGLPGGESAMARTVGLPAAAAVRLILEGGVAERGVLVPVHPGIYGPILASLGRQGVAFRTERTVLSGREERK